MGCLQILPHSLALNFNDAVKLDNTLNKLAKVKLDFHKYPGQSAWFKYFRWFNEKKFQVFEQILDLHDIYYEMQDDFGGKKKTSALDGVRKDVKTAIQKFQKFAQILYTANEIATIEMMTVPDSFYGYPTRVQIKICKVLIDLKAKLEKNDGIYKIYEKLNEIIRLSNSILRDELNISNEKRTSKLLPMILKVRNDFDKLFDWIKILRDRMEPFESAQAKIAELTKEAQPLKTLPILQQTRSPNVVIEDLMFKLRDVMTEKIETNLKLNWIMNNFMSVDMMDIQKNTTLGLEALRNHRSSSIERFHQVTEICLQGIEFDIEQIAARLNRKNDAIYSDLKSALDSLEYHDVRTEKNVLLYLDLKIVELDEYYKDDNINCVTLLQEALKISKSINDDVSNILTEPNTDVMSNFETKFESIMDKLSKTFEIVKKKTEMLFIPSWCSEEEKNVASFHYSSLQQLL